MTENTNTLGDWIDTITDTVDTETETDAVEDTNTSDTDRLSVVDDITSPLYEIINAGVTPGTVVDSWLDYVLNGFAGYPDEQTQIINSLSPSTPDENTNSQQTLTSHAVSNNTDWTRTRFDDATDAFITTSHDEQEDVLSRVFKTLDVVDTDVLAQNFTPSPIAEFIVHQTVNGDALEQYDGEPLARPVVAGDPSCGAGMFLAHLGYRFREFSPAPPVIVTGQDIDPVAAKASAINMVVHGVPGFIVVGDTLRMESNRVWRIGPVATDASPAFINELPPETLPDGFGSFSENTANLVKASTVDWDGTLPDTVGSTAYHDIPVDTVLFDAHDRLDSSVDRVLDV